MHVLVSKTMRGDAYGCFGMTAPRACMREAAMKMNRDRITWNRERGRENAQV